MPRRLDNVRILVVDDSADNRVLVNLLLKQEGAVVEQASGGEEALKLTKSKSYSVILLDIQMPGMDGYETLAQLKKANYPHPVIAFTAHAIREEKVRTAAAGFKDHLTKPIDKEQLVSAILRHI